MSVRLEDWGLRPQSEEEAMRRDVALILAKRAFEAGVLRPVPPIRRKK